MLNSVRLDEKSPAGCALTSWQDRLYLAWAGDGTKLNLAFSPDGRQFADPQRLSHRVLAYDNAGSSDSFSDWVITPPAILGAGELLHLAWTGSNSKVNVQAADTHNYFAPLVLGQRSTSAPALSLSARGEPVVAWTGTDRRINLLPLGRPTAKPVRLEQARSSLAPSVCRDGDSLVLAWTGTDRRVNLLFLSGDDQPGTHLRLEVARTGCAPAVCRHRDGLVLAWTGTDRRVNLLTLAEHGGSEPVRLEEARSVFAPAICDHQGRLTIAWVGTDSHINIGRLR